MRKAIAVLTAGFLWIALAAGAWAHEVRPTIGDLGLGPEGLVLDLDLNVEAFVAGVNLDGLEDTNAVPQAEAYDVARALSPQELEARFAPVASQMARDIVLELADGRRLDLRFRSVEIGPTGDVEILRDSRARFLAVPPPGAADLRLSWPDGYGTLILRQVGVTGGFTGFLDGGQTSDVMSFTVPRAAGSASLFAAFASIGFAEIVPMGFPFLLLALALFFGPSGAGNLAAQLGLLAVGHVAGLMAWFGGLANAGLPGLPIALALSVGLLAIGNITTQRVTPWRLLAVLATGGLQGIALSGALAAVIDPAMVTPAVFAGYIVGIELGGLTIIALAYLSVGHWFGHRPWYRARVARPVSMAIAALAMIWLAGGGSAVG